MAKRPNATSATLLDMVDEYRGSEKRRKTDTKAKLPNRVKTDEKPNLSRSSSTSTTFDLEGDDSESEEDWEEVDIDTRSHVTPVSVSFDPNAVRSEPEPRSKWDTKGTNVKKNTQRKPGGPKLSREERQRRISIHQIHVMTLLKHASIRNSWANDLLLQMQLRETVPATKLIGLTPDPSQTKMVRTSKFYEALKYLLQQWCKIWYTDSRGLHKKDFNELEDINSDSYDPPVTKEVFNKKVIRHRGSRDLKVQGFVALLRAVGLKARLVVSIQALDFASNAKSTEKTTKTDEKPQKNAPSVLRKPKFTTGQSKSAQKSQSRMHYTESPSPVYWAEVFEPTGKKWITLDPACEVNMEVVSKSGKSRLEPSVADKLNVLTYALAFNPNGTAVDVTRRYSSAYNSRTRALRISKYLAGSIWWNNLMGLFRPERAYETWQEELFLREKVLSEGFPKNIQMFKNHPRYVLERHLRQDEVLLPTAKACGIMSMKSNSKPENVYLRSDVQSVKSANKWYQIGRIIRPGQVCKKRKKMAKSRFRLEDEEDAPMYSFEQTEAYVPKPVVDGQVPKNGYGNVDLFTPAMLPPGGRHVSGKGAYMAAKSLGIDYANCVVGFDFTKGRQVKPRIDGVVVAERYARDVADVWSDMQEQTLAKEERNREVRALLRWRRYLTALKIRYRLDQEHGQVEGEEGHVSEEEHVTKEEEESRDSEVVIIDHPSDEPWHIPPSVLQPYLDKYLDKSAFTSRPVEVVSRELEEVAQKEPTPPETVVIEETPVAREPSVETISSDSSGGEPLSELSDVIKTPVKIDYASLAVDVDDSPDEMSESELYGEFDSE